MTDQASMLIVDDETSVRESLMHWFLPEGYRVETAAGGTEALDKLRDSSFDVALLDIKMPGMDGIELQQRLREIDGQLAIIIMTAYATVDTAVQALKQGAYDYITKPVDPDDLSRLVRNAIVQRRLLRENLSLKEGIRSLVSVDEIVGESRQVQEILKVVQTVAESDVTVMIQGASGTGKELIARAIHFNSKRRYFPLITINCGAMTDTLVESELFGHERGAFTGAQYRRKGKLELAHKGAIFLDEIGNIGPKTQMDLLRVIETKRFTRLGGNQVVEADFRIISATNRNLEEAVKEGMFRSDLFYRLQVAVVEIPPLRMRKDDILPLVRHFLAMFNAKYRKDLALTPETESVLLDYGWPGNVRELENLVHGLVIMLRKKWVDTADLPPSMVITTKEDADRSLNDIMADLERDLLRKALQIYGSAAEVAVHFNVDRSTIFRKLRKHGLR